MQKQSVDIKKLNKNAKLPVYSTEEAAGADLFALVEDEKIVIEKNQTVLVKTGLSVAIPKGLVGLIFARSGLASKKGIAPANKVGVIDSDYRGEIMVALHNHSENSFEVLNQERIAQIVFVPYVTADFKLKDDLDETERGEGGFGSTGK